MTRTEYDVVALGELLIDFTAQGAGADGYPLMAAHPGGAPANFLAAIARRDAARRRLCKGTREVHHLRPQSAPAALEKP